MIGQARRYPVAVPRRRRIATCFLIFAASAISQWVLVAAASQPPGETPSHLDRGVSDD